MADATRNCCGTSTLDECRCPPAGGHTPGPWWPFKNTADAWCVATYRDGEEPPVSVPSGENYGAVMCSCIGDHTEKRTRGNEEANARLIAASPTLLEALIAIDAMWSECDGERVDPIQARSGYVREVWEAARAAITLATGKDA